MPFYFEETIKQLLFLKIKAWLGFLPARDMQAVSSFFWLSLGVTLDLGKVGTLHPLWECLLGPWSYLILPGIFTVHPAWNLIRYWKLILEPNKNFFFLRPPLLRQVSVLLWYKYSTNYRKITLSRRRTKGGKVIWNLGDWKIMCLLHKY